MHIYVVFAIDDISDAVAKSMVMIRSSLMTAEKKKKEKKNLAGKKPKNGRSIEIKKRKPTMRRRKRRSKDLLMGDEGKTLKILILIRSNQRNSNDERELERQRIRRA